MLLVHTGVVCFLRCAVIPVGSRKADSDKSLEIPAMTEMIASSQGSPIFNPNVMTQLLPHIDDPHRLDVPAEACASATTTPASSTVTITTTTPCCFVIFTGKSIWPLFAPPRLTCFTVLTGWVAL